MLIALILGYLFLGGSGGGNPWFLGGQSAHQMSKEVAKVEPDKDKRKEIDSTLKQIEEAYKKAESERSKLEKETLKALENHESSAEEFQAITQRADAINSSTNETLLDLRFALKNQLSDTQWRQLFPPPTGQTSP